uniref:L1 transposable element RRM domain-containing protein n=1 Tax=Monopterus albus TaxID=43700 RepID=A0A3Q3J1Z3_MONAL
MFLQCTASVKTTNIFHITLTEPFLAPTAATADVSKQQKSSHRSRVHGAGTHRWEAATQQGQRGPSYPYPPLRSTEIRAMHDMLTNELAQLRSEQAAVAAGQQEIEDALSGALERVGAREQAQQDIAKDHKKLMDKCMDLENRSRRQNLRLVGIKEGAEGHNTIKFVAGFFSTVLGPDNFATPLVIDRAHRTLAPKPARHGERPRAILVRLHYYTDKMRILDLGRMKGRLTYEGAPVYIFPDMSPEVNKLRAAYNLVKKKLREANVEYSLFYPAKLCITLNGTRHSFNSPQAPASLLTVSPPGSGVSQSAGRLSLRRMNHFV